jgi:hypothetical protein
MGNKTTSQSTPQTREELKKEAVDALKSGDFQTAVVALMLVHEIDEAQKKLSEKK